MSSQRRLSSASGGSGPSSAPQPAAHPSVADRLAAVDLRDFTADVTVGGQLLEEAKCSFQVSNNTVLCSTGNEITLCARVRGTENPATILPIGRLYLVIKLDGMPSHIHLFCRGAPAGVGLSIASSEEEGRVYRTLEEICNIVKSLDSHNSQDARKSFPGAGLPSKTPLSQEEHPMQPASKKARTGSAHEDVVAHDIGGSTSRSGSFFRESWLAAVQRPKPDASAFMKPDSSRRTAGESSTLMERPKPLASAFGRTDKLPEWKTFAYRPSPRSKSPRAPKKLKASGNSSQAQAPDTAQSRPGQSSTTAAERNNLPAPSSSRTAKAPAAPGPDLTGLEQILDDALEIGIDFNTAFRILSNLVREGVPKTDIELASIIDRMPKEEPKARGPPKVVSLSDEPTVSQPTASNVQTTAGGSEQHEPTPKPAVPAPAAAAAAPPLPDKAPGDDRSKCQNCIDELANHVAGCGHLLACGDKECVAMVENWLSKKKTCMVCNKKVSKKLIKVVF